MTALSPGFAEPVRDSQRVFRGLLDALSRPGRVVDLGALPAPAPGLSPATAAACLTLADFETPVWLDPGIALEARRWIAFHCGCAIADDPAQAVLAIAAEGAPPPALDRFPAGDDAFPDRSATVILPVAGLDEGPGDGRGVRLSGPGIGGTARLAVDGLSAGFWEDWRRNHALFPRGVDVFLTCGSRVAGLPRTVKVEG